LGVQWHPEASVPSNPGSLALFRAFGEACRAWHDRLARAA
jgi:putative glutamine amidotransferase